MMKINNIKERSLEDIAGGYAGRVARNLVSKINPAKLGLTVGVMAILVASCGGPPDPIFDPNSSSQSLENAATFSGYINEDVPIATTGKKLPLLEKEWESKIEVTLPHQPKSIVGKGFVYPQVPPTLSISGDRLFIGDGKSIYVLSKQNGEVIGEIQPKSENFPIDYKTLTIADNVLYLKGESSIYAINVNSQNPKWHTGKIEDVGRPVIGADSLYVIGLERTRDYHRPNIQSIDNQNGNLNWRQDLESWTLGDYPIIRNDNIYVIGGDHGYNRGHIYTLNKNGKLKRSKMDDMLAHITSVENNIIAGNFLVWNYVGYDERGFFDEKGNINNEFCLNFFNLTERQISYQLCTDDEIIKIVSDGKKDVFVAYKNRIIPFSIEGGNVERLDNIDALEGIVDQFLINNILFVASVKDVLSIDRENFWLRDRIQDTVLLDKSLAFSDGALYVSGYSNGLFYVQKFSAPSATPIPIIEATMANTPIQVNPTPTSDIPTLALEPTPQITDSIAYREVNIVLPYEPPKSPNLIAKLYAHRELVEKNDDYIAYGKVSRLLDDLSLGNSFINFISQPLNGFQWIDLFNKLKQEAELDPDPTLEDILDVLASEPYKEKYVKIEVVWYQETPNGIERIEGHPDMDLETVKKLLGPLFPEKDTSYNRTPPDEYRNYRAQVRVTYDTGSLNGHQNQMGNPSNPIPIVLENPFYQRDTNNSLTLSPSGLRNMRPDVMRRMGLVPLDGLIGSGVEDLGDLYIQDTNTGYVGNKK